jgi:hypothetical protein
MRVADVEEAVLVEAVRDASSWAEVKRRCGLSPGGAVHAALRRRVEILGLPTDHLRGRHVIYSEQLLREVVARSDSVADVLRGLGLAQAGGSHAHVSRRIHALGIDISHFTRRANLQPVARRRLTPPEILVRRPHAEKRRPGALLTRALLAIGRPHVCAGCGTGPCWRGVPLVLSVDHIDGNWRNDEAANLRFLCPNCHSQTATFCRKTTPRVPCARGESNPHALSGTRT